MYIDKQYVITEQEDGIVLGDIILDGFVLDGFVLDGFVLDGLVGHHSQVIIVYRSMLESGE